MENKYWDLAAKELAGKASPAEQEELRRWVAADPAHANQYEAQARLWQLTAPGEVAAVDTDAAWEQVKARIQPQVLHQEAKIIPMFKTLMRSAAAVVLLIGIAWLVKYYLFPFYGMEVIESGQAQVEVTLPDSSRVWLNKESKLVYHPDFDGTERFVQLEGEAFFEVQKDSLRAFIIQTDKAKTTVLGTSFNLRAYPHEEQEELVVATGKVAFAAREQTAVVTLTPGNAATLSKQNNTIQTEAAWSGNAWAWRSGRLQFNGEPLKDVLPDLERYYGIRVQLQHTALGNCRFTGSFEQAELETVLQVLEATLQLNYQKKDAQTVILTGQGCS